MANLFHLALTMRHRNLIIHAAAMVFAVSFSVFCIFITDVVLPDFTARFDNYAFSATIPIAAAPMVVFPILWLLKRVESTQAALERLARTDMLTGVANRRGFFDAAEAEFARDAGPIAILMVDVDHFKQINDRHGHGAGDELLKRVATSIERTVGESIAIRRSVVGRIGGEEFAVLAVGTNEDGALRLAELLCRTARSLRVDQNGVWIGATVSVGAAVREARQPFDLVLRAADEAAYVAKRAGRDRWAFARTGDEIGEYLAAETKAA